ncbi:RNA polymerase sigma-70 factor [Chitinophaga sp. 22321]|uniref:RNA polymerase sigma-70 factor n=1 Tax=Chitinophaga hostae TaxID=2831022 RepID=A0ABS5JCM1_9BACT|nr:RNA polymerase sigma-70 factor [Chitinophaga hostae]MBS0032372.1 RNA polymerase sigma-70 factor [Chitinophaga hostae]
MSAWANMDDSELLHFLKKGDVRAFDAIYARHWPDLFKHAWYTLKCRDMAMDVVQEVFTWLWLHRETVQITSLKHYLKAATRFKMANFIRASKNRQVLINDLQYTTAVTVDPDDLAVRELKAVIAQAVSMLPGKCRAVYSLSRNEQLSHAEIASRLNITVKTVENQITIALKRIRLFIGHSMLLIFLLLSSL